MTGEEALRSLAEDCKRNVATASQEHTDSVALNARPFLTGAMIALVRAKALDHPKPLELLEELLAPIQQPLIDRGLLTRVTASFDSQAIGGVIASEGIEA